MQERSGLESVAVVEASRCVPAGLERGGRRGSMGFEGVRRGSRGFEGNRGGLAWKKGAWHGRKGWEWVFV